jgi:hypothetical protein
MEMNMRLCLSAVGGVTCAAVTLGLAQVRPTCDCNKKKIEVFYLPFDSDTLYPIDDQRIEESYDMSSLTKKSNHRIGESLLVSSGEPCSFANGAVRFKYKSAQGEVVIDRYGCMRKGGLDAKMSSAQLAALKGYLYGNTPIIDLK